MAAALALSGCTTQHGTPGPVGPGPDPGQLRLVSFSSCTDTLRHLKGAAKASVGPYGLGPSMITVALGAPPQVAGPESGVGRATDQTAPAPDHSGTNVHEAGMDEPDVVKTDGRRIVTILNGRLQVVDVAARAVTGTLDLGRSRLSVAAVGMLLAGDRALVIEHEYPLAEPDGQRWGGLPEIGSGPVPVPIPAAGSRLTLVDLAGGQPRLVNTLHFEGRYLDARLVGGTARVVLSSQPKLLFPAVASARDDVDRIRRNQAVIDTSTAADWLPGYRLEGGGSPVTGRVDCSRVNLPAHYAGSGLLTVLTIDLNTPLGTGDPVSVAADGEIVYATASSLYVTNSPQWSWPGAGPAADRTEVYQFDTGQSGPPRFVASSSVPGWLLNQYSMSEYDGHLRLATTSNPPWQEFAPGPGGGTESQVTVLGRRGDRLVTVGTVGGLGRGERIYAVRFIGPVGYVVTFRQVDPLYTVDLRDPAHPRLTGELTMLGYSSYLHPITDSRLLGVGQQATAEGRTQGTQVSLFDVGDPARPARTAQYHAPLGHSDAEFDPHAFLYWPATRTVVIPLQAYGPATPSSRPSGFDTGVLLLTVEDRALVPRGLVRQQLPGQQVPVPIQRSMMIGDTLWTLSAAGLQANDVRTLRQTGWVPLT
ncbi:MAG: beta-propeller domain-containing protein [Actinobacteria bacterium]|nr:beta-propeller domain-containing protein [Actinomycetota bacterium]